MRLARMLIVVVAAVVALGPIGPPGDAHSQGPSNTAASIDPYTLAPDVRRWTDEEDARDRDSFESANSAENRGDYSAGERPWRTALAIREVTWGRRHPVTAIALNNLAFNLDLQGRVAAAEPMHRRALAIRQDRLGPDHPSTATGFANLAINLEAQGRIAEAEPLYRRALEIREANFGDDDPNTATSLNNLAVNLEVQGRIAEAEPLYRRALTIRESLLGSDDPDFAQSLSSLAGVIEGQGRATEAEQLFRRALSITEASLGADHPDTATRLRNLALSLSVGGRASEAEPLLRRALAIYEARLGVDHPNTATSREELSVVHLRQGRPDLALAEARAALRTREELTSGAAASTAESARGAFAGNQGYAATLVMRAAWRTATPATAGTAMAEAFAAAQVMRASSASDALARGAARTSATQAGAGDAVAAWRGAQSRIAAIDAQFAATASLGAAGDGQMQALSSTRATAIVTLAEAERALSTRFPRYFDLVKAPPVALADLQATGGEHAKLLRANEALVLLTPGARGMPEGHRNGLVFVVTKTASAWAEIPLSPDDLAHDISALHKGLEDAATTTALPSPFDRAGAHALYRALFGAPEIAAALAGKDRWLLAPQGVLMSLPFAALVMAPPQGDDADVTELRRTAWLGLTKTLAVLPSVSALRVQRLYSRVSAGGERTPFFGLGDPAFQGVADAGVRGGAIGAARSYFRGVSVDLAQLARLPRLPGTATEIRGLAQSFGAGAGSYVLQLDASEAELRRRNASGALGRADIIAFATHGLLAGDFSFLAEPALALTPPVLAANAPVDPDNDGLLTASEAATLQLSARFVILSACNTAAGGAPDADALSGLARAFLYAGAQSLLVSHYPIFDDAGMRLTTEAARIARMTGVRNPEAMRQSMEKLMRDTSGDASGRSFAHPVYWAPFAVIDAS